MVEERGRVVVLVVKLSMTGVSAKDWSQHLQELIGTFSQIIDTSLTQVLSIELNP